MTVDFRDQVALVSRSGKGIGKAIATSFVKEWACVRINDIGARDAEKTAEELGRLGGKTLAIQADVS